MATAVLRFRDRILSSDGDVVCDYSLLLELARDGVDVSTLVAEDCDGVRKYNKVSKKPIKAWVDDGQVSGPPPETLAWKTPDPEDIASKIRALAVGLPPEYLDRVELEIKMFEERGMMPLIAHIDWMVRDWTERKVVWGAGRGSSCASLSLYLIGLHEVDPVKYDIPITEFLR